MADQDTPTYRIKGSGAIEFDVETANPSPALAALLTGIATAQIQDEILEAIEDEGDGVEKVGVEVTADGGDTVYELSGISTADPQFADRVIAAIHDEEAKRAAK